MSNIGAVKSLTDVNTQSDGYQNHEACVFDDLRENGT